MQAFDHSAQSEGQMWGICDTDSTQKDKCTPNQPQNHMKNPTPNIGLSIFEESKCNKAILIQSIKSFGLNMVFNHFNLFPCVI